MVRFESAAQTALFGGKLVLLLLWVAVTASGVAVVWSTNETRAQVNQLLELRSDANAMMVAHGQYLLQERSLSSSAGLELVAMEKLGLHFPEAQEIRVLGQ